MWGEWAVEAALERAFRADGGSGPAYEPIVGSGVNACVLHYVSNRDVIGDNDLVLVDAGAEFGLYAGDVTRTYPASGRFSDVQREVYDLVDEARAAAVATVRPGASMEEVHLAATEVLVRGLVTWGLLAGDPAEIIEQREHKKHYPHQTSHWLGLDVHDPGDYARGGAARALEPRHGIHGRARALLPARRDRERGVRRDGYPYRGRRAGHRRRVRGPHGRPPDRRGRGRGARGVFDMSEVEPEPTALILNELAEPGPMITVELRPPRTDLGREGVMSAWIDLHHTLGRLTRDGLFVFLTDNAVGAAEEESLAHLGANVADSIDLRRVVPILTTKHTLEYCETFARRAASEGFDALTVLGGDKEVGPPRCVPHGSDLRAILHEKVPSLALGGWANPHRDAAEQVDFVTAPDSHARFALTQIVSHHSLHGVERLLRAMDRSAAGVPTIFGVFFYRSANPNTLSTLSRFFPVPAEELSREFEAGASAEEICARSIRELRAAGAEKIYVSNLGNRTAGRQLKRILERV